MKTMVKVDDSKTGQAMYINPDNILYVSKEKESGLTLVTLVDGREFATKRLTSEVVKAVEDASK